MDGMHGWDACMGCMNGMNGWEVCMGCMDGMHGWDAIKFSFLSNNLKRCARVDLPPTGLYEQSFDSIPIDS